MWKRTLVIAVFSVTGCESSGVTASDGGSPDLAFVSNCTATPPGAEAKRTAGRIDDRSAILPGGRKVTPAGRLLDTGGYPISLRMLPGDRYVVVSDDAVGDQALLVVDLDAADPIHPVVSEKPYPIQGKNDHSAGLFYGIAASADGKRLWVSNGGWDPVADEKPASMHYNVVSAFDLVGQPGSPPQLKANDALSIRLAFRNTGSGFEARLPSGILLSPDEKRMYVATQNDSTLAIVNLEAGPDYGSEIGTAVLPGLGAYDVAVDEGSHTAFVSLWGGLKKGPRQYVDGVVPVDVTDPRHPMAAMEPLTTGKAAEAELYLAGKIYVTNADADTLSVIDAASLKVKTMPVTSSMILGATPNNLAIDPGVPNGRPGRIYIANANENAVVVLDLETLGIIGHIPTAWYPTAAAVRANGDVVIASARGLGYGPRDGKHDDVLTAGLLQVTPRPSDEELKKGTQTVFDNLDRPHSFEAKLDCPAGAKTAEKRFPIPAEAGAPSPIKYVFLIVRENKTYDSVFGDLEGGNGDPSLTQWTPEMIPNARDLAKRFVLLDNFYSHAELSIQGHEWTTGCIANDYVEKGWGAIEDYGRGYRPDTALSATSLGHLGFPGTGSIFVHLDQAKVAYHNYGEVTNTNDAKTLFDPQYPGVYFNTNILDVVKEDYVFGNILVSWQSGQLEPFSYILLPNDHTNATKDASQQPASMMADNDEATGRFVDHLSHSPLWGQSLVVVIEDDPGGGGDHVEQHRTICLMASPWLKRKLTSSTMFDLGSVYRTIELVLGVPPMNVYDGHAAALYELFSPVPDFTPYDHIARKIKPQTNQPGDPLFDESNKMDFSRPDRADLDRVLWKVTHGREAEPPWLDPRLKKNQRRSRVIQSVAVDEDD